MRYFTIILLVLFMLIIPCRALEQNDVYSAQKKALELEDLEKGARDYMDGLEMEQLDLDQGLEKVLETGSEALPGVIRKAVRSSVLLLVVVLLCSLGEGFSAGAGSSGIQTIPLVGALAILAIAVTDVRSLLGLGTETLGTMTDFSNILLPVVAALTAATGAITGAAARQMAAAAFSGLLLNLITTFFIPLIYAFIAASAAYAALGNDGMKRVAQLLKWVIHSVLTAVLLGFVGYLSVSGVIAGNADAATIKATKFAISNAVPVVGGILSDASEMVLASAGILRNTVGIYGMIAILLMCLVPFLQMGVHYLAYKFTSAVSATLADSRTAGLIDSIGTAFGLILGITGAAALLQLVILVSSLSVVAK